MHHQRHNRKKREERKRKREGKVKQDMAQSFFELCWLVGWCSSFVVSALVWLSCTLLLLIAIVLVVVQPSALGRVVLRLVATSGSRATVRGVARRRATREPAGRHTAHVSREAARRSSVVRSGWEAHALVVRRLALVVRSLVAAVGSLATRRSAHAGRRAAGSTGELTRKAGEAVRRHTGRHHTGRGKHAGTAQHRGSHHAGTAHAGRGSVRIDHKRTRGHVARAKSS